MEVNPNSTTGRCELGYVRLVKIKSDNTRKPTCVNQECGFRLCIKYVSGWPIYYCVQSATATTDQAMDDTQ